MSDRDLGITADRGHQCEVNEERREGLTRGEGEMGHRNTKSSK